MILPLLASETRSSLASFQKSQNLFRVAPQTFAHIPRTRTWTHLPPNTLFARNMGIWPLGSGWFPESSNATATAKSVFSKTVTENDLKKMRVSNELHFERGVLDGNKTLLQEFFKELVKPHINVQVINKTTYETRSFDLSTKEKMADLADQLSSLSKTHEIRLYV